MTHTPGPWVLDGPDHFNDYSIHPEGRALAIAAVCNGAINGLTGHGDEHEANARLIAAAPALLEALERVAGAYGFDPSVDSSIWHEVFTAIAAAKGAA